MLNSYFTVFANAKSNLKSMVSSLNKRRGWKGEIRLTSNLSWCIARKTSAINHNSLRLEGSIHTAKNSGVDASTEPPNQTANLWMGWLTTLTSTGCDWRTQKRRSKNKTTVAENHNFLSVYKDTDAYFYFPTKPSFRCKNPGINNLFYISLQPPMEVLKHGWSSRQHNILNI